jgi:hypothetical protein
MERSLDNMRYYEDENDYPFDYANMVENARFDDLLEEEDEGDEWVDSYHNLEADLIDE